MTGRNVAAGMSGGIAFVYDADNTVHTRCNLDMITTRRLQSEEEFQILQMLIERHHTYTESAAARKILENFPVASQAFTVIVPKELPHFAQEQWKRMAGNLWQSSHFSSSSPTLV